MDEPKWNVSKSKDNILIVHDLMERSPDGDGDESDNIYKYEIVDTHAKF